MSGIEIVNERHVLVISKRESVEGGEKSLGNECEQHQILHVDDSE
jgi:hypothetical protein